MRQSAEVNKSIFLLFKCTLESESDAISNIYMYTVHVAELTIKQTLTKKMHKLK